MNITRHVAAVLLVMVSFHAYALPITTGSSEFEDTTAFTPPADCLTGPCFAGGLSDSQLLLQQFAPRRFAAGFYSKSPLTPTLSTVATQCQAGSWHGGLCIEEAEITAVPEPGSILLLGIGMFLLALRRRKPRLAEL